MKITDLLTVELVLPALEVDGKDEAIETVAIRLAAHHAHVDGECLVQALRDRERQVTTALGDGVAIPHARLAGLDRTVAAFARSTTGVPWDAPDGGPAHLVFVLAGPAESPGVYLKALAGASRLLSDARCRARLMAAADEAELLLVLRQEDERAGFAVRAA